jgi:hypothetical protein
LAIWKKKVNILAPKTRTIILAWWAFEICMTPNQKEVVRKRHGPHLYEKKLIQYLMEIHVFFIISAFVLFYQVFL